MGSSRAGEAGCGGADDGRAPALERLGLPVCVAASRDWGLGLAGVTCGFGARRRILGGAGLGRASIVGSGLGLSAWGARGGRRTAGPGSDLGLTAGARRSRRRADMGLSRSRITAGGSARGAGVGGPCSSRPRVGASGGRNSGPSVGRSLGSASSLEPACRGARATASSCCRRAERSGRRA